MRYAINKLSVGCTLAAVLGFCGSARAAPYSLEIIAQRGDFIDDRLITGFGLEVNNVAINDDREVAFFARVDGPQGPRNALMTQRRFIAGAGTLVDGRLTAISSEASVAINNRGEVAYRARAYTTTILNAVSALYVNQTRLFQQGDVIDGQRIAVFTEPIAINDAGTVLFNASIDLFDATTHIFTQSEFVAESGLMFDGFTAHNFFRPQINNAGDVAFLGHLQELFPGQDLAVLSPDGIILKTGDSIENLTVESIRTLSGITDDGDVLMSMSSTVADGERVLFIGTQDRILFRTGDIVAGIEVPHFVGPPVLNNQGQLAFLGSVPAPGRIGYMPDRQGILFVDGEVVISEGDILDGKVIRELHPLFDMNDRGDLAFRVVFDDFSPALVLATRFVPEPSSFLLAMLAICVLLARTHRRSRKRKGPQ